ncbi:MAG: UvrD-helicase domain-containing protein [Candidatus Peregrinibacteria bacterium]
MHFLSHLNPAQRLAAEHKDGPLLVIAGAGSGKTRVLTYRIAALLSQGVLPREILAVTFTNKAAGEMKERVRVLLGEETPVPTIGTFHSIGAQFLRREIEVIGRDRSFTIYDSADTLSLVKRILKERNIDPQFIAPKGLLANISAWKSSMKLPDEAKAEAENTRGQIMAECYSEYETALLKNNALDFDDLILRPIEVFQASPNTLQKYQRWWKYILIDEYQDTNYLQYLFAKLIAEDHHNICAIGDTDQSIYRFRGADIGNILAFQKEYPKVTVVKLEQNYRSTKNILAGADGVIKNNQSRIEKKMTTENPEGDAIQVWECSDERDEAERIFRTMDTLIKNGKSPKDMAILYRTNAQSRALEESAMRHGLPYTMVGGLKFYARAEVKDILAYLRLVVNKTDAVSLERIINVPSRKIGETSLLRIRAFAQERGVEIGAILAHITGAEGISPATKNAIQSFGALIERFREEQKTETLSKFIEKVVRETGYEAFLKRDGEEGEMRLENIRELISVAKKYDDLDPEQALPLFLEGVALVSDIDETDGKKDSVTLMTIHASKGLEFPVVFVAGCEENIFPSSRSLFTPEDLEEERRLMYVAMTRAMEKLVLTYARSRLLYGDFMSNPPSRFLQEIPEEVCEGNVFTNYSSSSFSAPEDNFEMVLDFEKGDIVEHPTFGIGKILNIEGDILTIAFQTAGQRRLAASIAPLQKRDPEFL